MKSLRPLQRAAFTDVLDYGIFLFKKHFKKLFLINLMFNIPVMLLLTIFNPVFTQQYWNLVNPNDFVMTTPNEAFSSIFTIYAMLFGSLGLQGIYTITLKNIWEGSIVKILYADVVLNQERTIKQVIKECFKQFGTLLLGRLLYILIQSAIFMGLYIVIFVGVFALVFGTVGVGATAFVAPWLTVVLTILGILVTVALIFFVSITVGWLYGRFWMFLPSICVEQQKAGTSIGRGGNLGKNSFFLIGLTFISSNILVGLLPLIANTIISLVSLGSGNLDVGLFRVGAVITQLFAEIMRPFITCVLTALYITLRVRREGLDMEVTLWEIKKEENDRRKRWLSEAPNADQ
ncbi:MAG: hypothetical protein GX283_01250 [Clostridiaceae bacterium]|jgi:hypothetical protein|nr:hypothetical protein [Clostridiaceae bacterium]